MVGGLRYRGVPIGTVTQIGIDLENVELIEVTLAIKKGTPIKTDTIASLALQGITGLSFVQLTGGTRNAPTLEPRPGKRARQSRRARPRSSRSSRTPRSWSPRSVPSPAAPARY